MRFYQLLLILKNKILRLEVISVFWAAAILTFILLIKPIIGVADNGDFGRIMGPAGLEHIAEDYRDKYFGYFNREYRITPPASLYGSYFSTEVFLVKLAKMLNFIFHPYNDIFDIRFLSVIYSAILLTALYLIIKVNKPKALAGGIVLALLLTLIFTDIGYISYFNSFYGEALSLTSFLLVIALAMCLIKQKTPKTITLIGFCLAALLLTGAKLQNVPIGIILSVFSLRFLSLRKDRLWRSTIITFALLLVLISFKSYLSVPENIRVCNKYQSVFFGVLKDSPSPDSDLKELGIDRALSVLAGTNYFMKEYPININDPWLMEEVNSNISPFKVSLFYLKHPLRYLEKLHISAKHGFKLLQGFGSFEKSENKGYRKVAESFRFWSDFKMNVLPHSLILIVMLFLGYFTVLMLKWIRAGSLSEKIHLEILLLIGLIGIVQFIIPIIADGEADLSKHLFLFNMCFDIISVIGVTFIVTLASTYLKRLFNSSIPRLLHPK